MLTLFNPLKFRVYRRKLSILEVLREEIVAPFAGIPVDILATVPRALVRRTQKCLQANGGYYEYLFHFNMWRSHPFLRISNLDY
jgi:hypothetical protein